MTYKARVEATGPAASYPFAFPSLDQDHVVAYVAGVADSGRTFGSYTASGGGTVVLSVTPGATDLVVVVRETPSGALVDFAGAATLTEEDLDTANRQSLYVAEEADDKAALAFTTADAVTGIVLAAEVAAALSEAAAAASETAAAVSAAAALVSETNAAASETAAGVSETNAAASAAAALVSENNASASEAAAGISETASAASEVAAGLSETASAASETAAGISETNAAASAVAALASEDAAAISETNAAASASLAASLTTGVLTFQGTWAASSAVLPTPVTDTDFWYASDGGSAGGFDFILGDMLFYTEPGGTPTWYKVDNTEPSAVMTAGDTMTGPLVINGSSGTALTTYVPNTSTGALFKGDNFGVRVGFDGGAAYIDSVTAAVSDFAPLAINAKTTMELNLDSGAFSVDLSVADGMVVTGHTRSSNGMPMNSIGSSTGTVSTGWVGYLFGLEAACTLTVPTNASDPIPVGAEIVFWQIGAGTVTFTPAGGVTIYSKDSMLSLSGQYSAATLKKVGTDAWFLFGGLA